MKTRMFAVLLAAVISVSADLSCSAESAFPSQNLQKCSIPVRCAPQPPVQPPVARSVSVRVPIACPVPAAPMIGCREIPRRPSPPLPVRVEIGIRPESSCDNRAVPLSFRDPGPVQPVISHGVGLVAALVAAPFRLIETVCPVRPQRQCSAAPAALMTNPHPVHPSPFNAYGPPGASHQAHLNRPMICPPPHGACAPPVPAISPIPPAGCPPPGSCLPPPTLVREWQLPALEPQSLIGGLWNLPAELLTRGRRDGDCGRDVRPQSW